MTIPRICVLTCLAAIALTAPVHASQERITANGTGQSEFEAVKAASKKIMDEALKLVLGRAATLDEPARRRFERDIEEEFRQTRARFFRDMDASCRDEHRFVCSVVAVVDMLEVESAVSNYVDESASNRLRVALSVNRDKVGSGAGADAVVFLHNQLELQMGYDIYFVDRYVEVDALRNGCQDYAAIIDQYRKKGPGFATAVVQLEANNRACLELLDRDAVIVVDDIDIDVGAYDPGQSLIEGTITPRLSFHRTDSARRLPAPRPLTINKYGEGSSQSFATSDLINNLSIDAANYIAQQYNEIVLSRQVRKRLERDGVGPAREYTVRVNGISRDDPSGRRQLQFIELWFEDNYDELVPALGQGGRSEHVYEFSPGNKPRFLELTDDLRDALEQRGANADVDIDRSRNLTISFATEPTAAEPKVAWNDRRISKAFAVEKIALNTIREDQATGVEMSLLQAELTIRNKKRGDYAFTVEPVWRDARGTVVASDYSQVKAMAVDGKATRSVLFRAPSKRAQTVEFVMQCASKDCK